MKDDNSEDVLKQTSEDGTQFIYRMTITVKGKKIRRKNGRPFKIPVKN
jgi:hypothetical protein